MRPLTQLPTVVRYLATIYPRPSAKSDTVATRRPADGPKMQTTLFLHERYLLRRSLRPGSVDALIWTVGKFDRWFFAQHSRVSLIADLTDDTISRFIRDAEPHHSPKYVKRLRGDLIGIANEAADQYPEQVRAPNPKKIRDVRVPRRTPEAWSRAEVKRLLESCVALDGYYPNGIAKPNYWRTLIGIAWDTGLRISDVRVLRYDALREGSLSVTQEKTGLTHWAPLSAKTLAEIDKIANPPRELIVPWPLSRQAFLGHFGKIVAAAGLKGTPKKLRKSAASEVERQQPGAAQQFLGHATPGLAYKNYVDPRIANPTRPRPMPLDDEADESSS